VRPLTVEIVTVWLTNWGRDYSKRQNHRYPSLHACRADMPARLSDDDQYSIIILGLHRVSAARIERGVWTSKG
jgi:hypothetical protein